MDTPLDSFQMFLAFYPPAIYVLAIGAINLRRRPLVISGTRDTAVLSLSLLGLAMVGPMELCFPESAALHLLGPYVWIPLLSLYGLCVVLILLTIRPRLVVYNISMEELRRALAEVVDRLDSEARWAGDSLFLPRLGVQLHLDSVPAMRNVSLVASGPQQNHLGWQKLHRGLAEALRETRVARNRRGIFLVVAAVAVMVALIWWADVHDPAGTYRAMCEMFRI